MSHAEGLHRREFAWQMLGGLGAMSVATELTSAADQPPPPALPEDPRTEPPEQTPPVEVLLLTALVRNYPSEHYTDEVLRGIYGDIAGDVARGKQLRTVSLQNSDEPACVFRAFRGDSLDFEGIP